MSAYTSGTGWTQVGIFHEDGHYNPSRLTDRCCTGQGAGCLCLAQSRLTQIIVYPTFYHLLFLRSDHSVKLSIAESVRNYAKLTARGFEVAGTLDSLAGPDPTAIVCAEVTGSFQRAGLRIRPAAL